MPKFIHRESHLHLTAKLKLYDWLKECDQHEFGPVIHPFSWRTGGHGVHLELPFYETSHPYYFELSGGALQNGKFDPTFDRGQYIFIPDIVIFDRGLAAIIIEVVYTSFVDPEKDHKISKFFDSHPTEVWQVSAKEIMRHTSRPEKIEATKIR